MMEIMNNRMNRLHFCMFLPYFCLLFWSIFINFAKKRYKTTTHK